MNNTEVLNECQDKSIEMNAVLYEVDKVDDIAIRAMNYAESIRDFDFNEQKIETSHLLLKGVLSALSDISGIANDIRTNH